ncbi:beta-carotene 15,15'-dioxygenase, Brp/Blh family [Geodermatophilus sp. SYSU D00742]
MAGRTAVGPSSPLGTATVVSLGAALLGLAVELVVPGGWGSGAEAVLVAGLLLGLPHGAVDHVLLGARAGRSPGRQAAVAGGYAALAAASWLLFRAFPGPGLAVFVAVSVWHFGSGETAVADLRAGGPVRRRVPAAVVLGSVVLLVPLARPSPEAAEVVAAVLPGHPEGVPLLPPAVVPVVVAAAVVLGAALLLRRRRLEALEVAVLLAVGLLLPPPAALGLWFGTWHAVRHVARVVAEDPGAEPAAALRRFLRASALPTAVALGALVVLWQTTDGGRGLVVALLPVLAALTVPHALVVSWLDREQGSAGRQAAGRRIGTCGMPSST